MKRILGTLFIGLVLWNSSSMAACLKDIAMAEVAGNSYSYQYEKADGSSININSKTSLSTFFSWFIYCTEARWEFRPFFEIRKIQFDSADTSGPRRSKDSYTFLNLGSDFVRIINIKSEILFALEFNKDLLWKPAPDYSSISAIEADMIRAQIGYIRAIHLGKYWRVRGQGRLLIIYPTQQYFSDKVTGTGALLGFDTLYRMRKNISLGIGGDFSVQSFSIGNEQFRTVKFETLLGLVAKF